MYKLLVTLLQEKPKKNLFCISYYSSKFNQKTSSFKSPKFEVTYTVLHQVFDDISIIYGW